jgi:hypothetical protein
MSSAQEPLGAAALVDFEGLVVITDLTPADRFIVARLQDVEDHPDLILEEAA